MGAKNTVREILPWKKSRNYFYWRLRCRLHVQKIYLQIQNISIEYLTKRIEDLVKDGMKVQILTDYSIAAWCDRNPKSLENLIKQIKQEIMIDRAVTLLKKFPEGLRSGIKFLQK